MAPMILTDLDILSLTIYGEARGDSVESQIGVGCTVRNRVNLDLGHDGKPDWWGEGYSDVCLKPSQFSCWNIGDPNHALLAGLADQLRAGAVINWPAFVQCRWVADGVIADRVMDRTKGATHYYEQHVSPPSWSVGATFTTHLGGHIFYKDVK